MTEEITKSEAIDLIEDAEHGTLTILHTEDVPTLGEVPESDREKSAHIKSYQFGEVPDVDHLE